MSKVIVTVVVAQSEADCRTNYVGTEMLCMLQVKTGARNWTENSKQMKPWLGCNLANGGFT